MYTNQQRFGVEEGLPQSYIKGITQDQDGFIWIATLDGLSRYDGRGFKNFRSKPGDSTGLSRNAIISMVSQVDNKLSLIYEGLFADHFDMRAFTTSRIPFLQKLQNIPGAVWYVVNVSNAYNGTHWFFTADQYKGAGWLNCKDGKITYANKSNGLLQQDTISAFLQTTGGRLYLISEDGVQVSDSAKSKFEFIRFPTTIKRHSLREYQERPFFGRSVAILPGNKLAVYELNTIVILDLDRRTVQSFEIPAPMHSGFYDEKERVLNTDAKGQVYFVNAGRIFRITEQGTLELLWQNTIAPHLNITTYYIDRSDVLWVSVNAQGLAKIDLHSQSFRSFRFQHNFIADIMQQAGVPLTALPSHWSAFGEWYFFRQAYDSKQRLYACYNFYDKNEILWFDGKKVNFFPHVPRRAIYTALAAMPDNEIRVFDQLSATWYCWKSPDAVPYTIALDKAEMNNVRLADARFVGGFMWLSTYSHGLLQYDGSKRINQFIGSLPSGYLPKELTEICPDPINKKQFWIGSRGDGLILWDVDKGLQKVYTTDDGLPNNTIYCILPDKGTIWCSTNKGIFRLNRVSGEINSFEKWDGLPGNEFNRVEKFGFTDGRIAFGGLEGYTIFNPADFDKKKPSVSVPVQLTALQINNELQGDKSRGDFLKTPIGLLNSIHLPYNKNYLRFEFAAMIYNQPQKTKYRYQLQSVDEGWLEIGTSNVISFAALRPGNYKLLINATDNNGKWSNAVKEIAITIDSPPWATWWAYLIYVLIALGLIKWYFIYREKRIRIAQSLAFEKREALRLKEMDEVKDRFFSNVTHEFRTPLTLIITPLEKLIRHESLPSPVMQTLKTIEKNSRQLLRLINELLDFSKLNDGRMKVKLSSGDLSLFIVNCVQSFEAAAKEKNIQLSFACEKIEGLYLFDEEKWEKIITNLLGNALKFTPPHGEVSVNAIGKDNEVVKLEVKDNGPGIPTDQQQKIFERFYQADDSAIRNYGGTGIGLSLVKELVELMEGTIAIDSQPGNYCRFIVHIPVQAAQFQDTALSKKPIEVTEKMTAPTKDQDGPLIMIVEDNDELRSFLVESMSRHYRVISAADGLRAWEIIEEELPDIVISDVMMPGRDGFSLCSLCKSDKRTAHIGFILLTSKSTHDARITGLGKGADAYISKPFHLDELELFTANLVQLQHNVRTHLRAQLMTTRPPEQLLELTDPFLVQLYKEIDDKIDDPALGIDYLCKTLGMSRSALNRKLKSLLATSTADFIRQYRLQKATAYLSKGVDIATTAYMVGFSSHSYFSQCFREQYGLTPSDYVSEQQ